jgi:hypothetical protein
MSAADPAPIPPVVANAAGDAAVIDITTRAGRRHTSQGRWKKMGDTPPGPAPDTPDPDPRQGLAERFEEIFNEHRLSLTDGKVAASYTVTLHIVRGMLDGAHARGIVDEEQRQELDAMIEGIVGIPPLVATGE